MAAILMFISAAILGVAGVVYCQESESTKVLQYNLEESRLNTATARAEANSYREIAYKTPVLYTSVFLVQYWHDVGGAEERSSFVFSDYNRAIEFLKVQQSKSIGHGNGTLFQQIEVR